MPFFPMMATGWVGHFTSARAAFMGTYFAYQKRHVLLTARHCIPDDWETKLYVVGQTEDKPRQVVKVCNHPTSDVALMVLEPVDGDETWSAQVLSGIPEGVIDGGEFDAYGFQGEGSPTAKPVGRWLKGHFQRYFGFNSATGYDYFAGEMSAPAPAGTSGGPVLRRGTSELEGIITTNVESSTILDKVDELDEGGTRTRIETHRVITYGIAAMAVSIRPWLVEQDLGLH